MAQISALRQQDWAAAYQDGSGQWMQLEDSAAVYGTPAMDESGAYSGSYGPAVDESGGYSGWVDVPAPMPAPAPAPVAAPAPEPAPISVVAPAPTPVSYAVSYDEGGAPVYVPVYEAPTPAAPVYEAPAPVYTVSYDEAGVSIYTPVYEAPAPVSAPVSVVSEPVVVPTPAPAPPVAPAPAPVVAAPAPAAVALPSFEIQSTPPRNRTAEEWSQVATTWNANSQADSYRLYQQMSEHGWSAADVAYATGQSVQAVGDYLTRIGAEAGFGGSATLGRETVDGAYLSALQNAQAQGTTAFTTVHASLDESGQPLRDESGQPVMISQFDTAGFTAWYATQGTAEAQAFARIHGNGGADEAGGVQLASGAHVVQGTDEAGNALAPVIDWAMDGRISAYQGYAKGNVLDQAGMAGVVQTALNDQLIQTFGNPNAALPGNELGERMRALYGTELATYMLQVQGAADAMKSRYVSDLNAVLAQRPTTVGVSSPFWKAGAVHVDESGSYIHVDESGQPITIQDYEFDAAAFQQWYAQQGTAQQLITQAYGAQVAEASAGGFKTAGTTDQLNLSLSFDESGLLSAQDVTLSMQELTTINIADPPDLYNSGAVSFMPMQGFVTSVNNIKPEEDWFDQLIPIIIVAVVSYFSAGTLGPAAAGAMGLAEGTLAATVVSAAVAGAITSTVSGALNGNLSFKTILQGALSGALTAGVTAGLGEVAGAQLASMGTAGRVLQSMTVQGAVRALMGGSFEEGLVAGLASGLSSAVCAQINGNIAQALNAGTMTAAEASAARYFSSMLGAAIKIVAVGADAPGYALANAFIEETFAQVDGGVLQPTPVATGPQGGTPAAPAAGDETSTQGSSTGDAATDTSTSGTTADDASSSEGTGTTAPSPADAVPDTNNGPSIEVRFPDAVSTGGYRQSNGEYVDTVGAPAVGNLSLDRGAPVSIPAALLPEGVQPGQVYAAVDAAGNRYYAFDNRPELGLITANTFIARAQDLLDLGEQGLQSGALTPSQYLEASRFVSANETYSQALLQQNNEASAWAGFSLASATIPVRLAPAAELVETVVSAGRVLVSAGELLAVGAVDLAALGLVLLIAPANSLSQVTSLNEQQRFVTRPGELYGSLQERDAQGQWVVVRDNVMLGQVGGQRVALSPEEVRELTRPITTPADPLPPQHPGGYLPLPEGDKPSPILPGAPIDQPQGPTIEVLPAHQQDWRDLIITSNAQNSNGFYGSIPDEDRWRYDRYLNETGRESPLGPDEWYRKAQTAWENTAAGNEFEQAARARLNAPLGAGSKPVSIEGYVPDLPVGDKYGVTDIKNWLELSDSGQLRAFYRYAADNNLPFNIIIGPRTERISEPLLDNIRNTGGSVVQYDPATNKFTKVDIGQSGPWTRGKP